MTLLGPMYIYKNCRNVEHVFARNTFQGNRFHFITDNYQSVKYKNSSYFKGTLLWNSLPDDLLLLESLDELKAYIPLRRKIPGVGGWCWAMPPMPEFCVGDTNMLVYFGVT